MFSFIFTAFVLLRTVLAVKYSQYILAPSSRTITPASVYNINGTVQNAKAQTATVGNGSTTFQDVSAVTYDMGKNIAGIVSFNVDTVNGDNQFIGVSFTESSLWINSDGCDATADAGVDVPLWFQVKPGSYTADKKYQRGGFRYMNVYHNSTGSVALSQLSVHFTAVSQLTENQMANYTGYFHSSDEKINRVWYAGAYTNQMCTIDPTTGDSLVHLGAINSSSHVTELVTWWNNYTIANGSSVLVDGAKRDRLVWPGDIAISGPSMIVSTYDIDTIRNALDSLLVLQNRTTGQLPYAGTPFNKNGPSFSFTYHLYSLIDIADYYQYTGNLTYLRENWDTFKFGLSWSLSQIDKSGLANVTSPNDWLRFGMGGHNIEANAIFYYTLNRAISLANTLNDTTVISNYTNAATAIKSSANRLLWDQSSSLFRDNETTTLHPQDGNVWAVYANLTLTPSQNSLISHALHSRWTPYGAPSPEASNAISPFISSFELRAHILASNPTYALALIRTMWSDFMLDDPRMTNSTFIEGYASSGELHYAPYTNDARVSHAHGWATGPTSALTLYVAGIDILDAGGEVWQMKPYPGDLETVEAGFSTAVGWFEASLKQTSTTAGGGMMRVQQFNFSAPVGTSGSLSLPDPGCAGSMSVVETSGRAQQRTVNINRAGGNGNGTRVEVNGLVGGDWKVNVRCADASGSSNSNGTDSGASMDWVMGWLFAVLALVI
ncbi:MAG: hypothetical protein Q9227_007873 [Pyrenula ochraceoflavens]